jgi:hypothetical protein
MDDGQELAYIIGALHGAEMENALTCREVYALIFHGTGIARTGSIDCPGISLYLHGQRQYRVVAVVGRVLKIQL